MSTEIIRAGVHSDQGADELRGAMVDEVVVRRGRLGLVPPREVEAALRTVPRHLFAPGVALEQAYVDDSIVTTRNERGVNISAVSAPTIIVGMLGQLQVKPGQRVLEIGSGGYNAALLRELVGPDGSVTTIDIDQEVVDRARVRLSAAGYRDVRVLCGDGEFGPFDRIIVTVGARDIPPAWVEQLAEGGRLVVPLRTKGLGRSWTLERSGRHLVSRDHMMCGFVPMQGVGEHRGCEIPLHGEEVGLWLAVLPEFCLLTAKQEAVDRGLVSPGWPLGTPALVVGGSLSYRAKLRRVNAEGTVSEFGAYAHGPNAVEAADRLAEQTRIWDRDHRHGPGPRMTVHPSDAPDAELPSGLVVDRRHTRIVISWPE